MNEIKESLKIREKQLLNLKKGIEKSLKKAPKGTLRICQSKNRTQFYHRTNPKDFNGKYIPQKNHLLAKNLAQKDYNQKLLSSIEKELFAIQKYLQSFPELNVKEFIWEHFGMMDDPTYAENAIQKIVTYEQNGFFPGKNLILTYECKNNPINHKLIQVSIQEYLQ